MPRVLAFISIAVRNVVRNRQKTLTSVLGIILAVTVIFGQTISLEFQSGAVLQHEMEKRNVHFSIDGEVFSQTSRTGLRSLLHGLMDVSGIARYSISLDMYPHKDSWGNVDSIVVHIPEVNASNSSYHSLRGVYGSLVTNDVPVAPPRGSVLLPSRFRDQSGLVIGQPINLTFSTISIEYDRYGDSGPNVTIVRMFGIHQYTIAGFWSENWRVMDKPWYDPSHQEPTMIHLHGDDLIDIFQLNIEGGGSGTSDFDITPRFDFQFRYTALLDPALYRETSLKGVERNAARVEGDLSRVISIHRDTYGFGNVDIESRYQDPIDDIEMYFYDMRYMLIALSVPIIIFGLYLGYLGIDLFLSERRREIGMLKARGATNRQLMCLLVTESLLVGAFAGGAGILLGDYGARLIAGYTGASSGVETPWYHPAFSAGAFLSAVALGMILMLASSVRLLRRITGLDAGELLSRYSVRQEKRYNASRDLKILWLAAVCLVTIRFFEPLRDLADRVDSIILSLVLGVFLYLVVPVMVVSAPYIIILIGIRLATRGSNVLFIRLAELAERLTGELGYLIRRGIATGNRRIVNLTTVLSVLFAFLVLTSTFTFAEEDLEERTIRTMIGSDVQVTFEDRMSVNETRWFRENVTLLPGIDTVLPIFSGSGRLLTSMGGSTGTISPNPYDKRFPPLTLYVINCSTYAAIAYFDSALFVQGSRDDVRSLHTGGMIISSKLAQQADTETGDERTIGNSFRVREGGRYTLATIGIGSLKVEGIMKALPGISWSLAGDRSDNWVLIHDRVYSDLLGGLDPEERAMWKQYNPIYSPITLIKTSGPVDPADLSLYIGSLDIKEVRSVRSASFEIDAVRTKHTSDSWVMVLRTELGILVFISLIASGTVVFISSFEKIRERAAIMLRGTTSRQLYALEFGEASVILLYALAVGIITGYLAGMVWIYVFNVFENDMIGRSYAPSFGMLPIIGVMVGIFLAAVAVSTIRLRRYDLIGFMRWG